MNTLARWRRCRPSTRSLLADRSGARWGWLAGLALLANDGTGVRSAAQTFDVFAHLASGGEERTSERHQAGGLDLSLSRQGPAGLASTWGRATADVGPGYLKLSLDATADAVSPAWWQGSTSGLSLQGGVEAAYRDVVTINAPGLAGEFGTAILSVSISGSVGVGASPSGPATEFARAYGGAAASASFGVFAGVGGYGDGTLLAGAAANVLFDGNTQTGTAHDDIPAEIDLSFHFIFGQPFEIGLDLDLTGSADAGGQVFGCCGPSLSIETSMSADYGRSFYFDGLAGVTDAQGVPLAGGSYSVSSGSGVDYTQSFVPPAIIPEPASVGLASGAVLALLAGACRGWRRRVA